MIKQFVRGVNVAGFTVLELMTTVAIFSLLTAIALPSFSKIGMKNHMQVSMSRLSDSLKIAHSLTQQGVNSVTVCASSDGETCSNSNHWEHGWIVFYDISTGIELAQVVGKQNNAIKLRASGFSDNTMIELEPATALKIHDHVGTFYTCVKGGEVNPIGIITNSSGVIIHASDENGNQIVEDNFGLDVTCPV